ncbi:hypothetical protein [Enterococcus sp. N249-2]
MSEEVILSHQETKQVYIFSISNWISDGEFQTQRLQMKLQKQLTNIGYSVDVHMYSASKIETLAPKADIILLTPEYSFALTQLQQAFPSKPIVTVNKQDYGLLNMSSIVASLNKFL